MNFDENELMSSTWEHRAWVWGTSTFLAITFASGLAGVQDTWTCCSVTLAMVAAYYMAGRRLDANANPKSYITCSGLKCYPSCLLLINDSLLEFRFFSAGLQLLSAI